MATSKGLTSAYVPEATPEAISANQQYNEAMRKLVESLDSRKNRLFDPTLLAMAEGFLSPTKTGGFGESLGIAAGKVRAAEEEEAKRDIEDARARMEVAQLGAQMERQRQLDAPFQRMFSTQGAPSRPAQAGRPAAPSDAVGSATPADSTPIVAKYGASSDGRRIMDPQPLPDKNEFFLTRRAQGIPFADVEKQWLEILNKDVEMRDGYIFQRSTGMAFDLKEDVTPTPIQLRTVPGTGSFMVSGVLARDHNRLLRKAMESGDPAALAQLKEFERRLIQTFPEEPQKTTTVGSQAAQALGQVDTGRIQSKSEAEASAAAAAKTAEGMAARNVKETSEFLDAGVASRNLLPIYARAETIVTTTPGIEDALGILEKSGDIKSFIGSLAEDALRVGNFNVGIPSIRKSLTNMKVPQNVIDKVAELTQLAAMWQFEQRRGLGSGTSVSNFEQQMVNAMGPNITDSKESYLQKLRFMRNQAEFRAKLASELRARKMQYNEFEGTAEFQKMFEDYKQKQTSLVDSTTSQPQQPSGSWRHQRRQ